MNQPRYLNSVLYCWNYMCDYFIVVPLGWCLVALVAIINYLHPLYTALEMQLLVFSVNMLFVLMFYFVLPRAMRRNPHAFGWYPERALAAS